MTIVTVSPKFQVVIPREIRETLQIHAGQKVHAFAYDNRVEFIPVKSAKEMRGFLKGMDTHIEREDDRI